MPIHAVKYLAEKWIGEYGAAAPTQIRRWATDANNALADVEFFEQITQAAEAMLATRARSDP